MSNRNVAILLALFGGFVGLQKYYMKNIFSGVMFSIFSFTGIPFILSLFDVVKFALMKDAEFDRRYGLEEKPVQSKPRRTYEEQIPPKKTTITTVQEAIEEGDYEKAYIRNKRILDKEGANARNMFDMACIETKRNNIYSAYQYLQKAYQQGYNDEERIKKHPLLQELREDENWEQFVANNYIVNWEQQPFKRSSLLEQLNEQNNKRRRTIEKVEHKRDDNNKEGNEYDEIFR